MSTNYTPRTPSKRFMEDQQLRAVPASPDMKNARNRLDSLLSGIRKGDAQRTSTFRDGTPDESKASLMPQSMHIPNRQNVPSSAITNNAVEDVEARRGPGRPKRTRREKKVVFELRGKSFDMRDLDRTETIYSMCRKWMYGRDDEPPAAETKYPPLPEDISLDLLATKPIYSLPKPNKNIPIGRLAPGPEQLPKRDPEPKYAGKADAECPRILENHLRHWRKVRRSHIDFNESRRKRYDKSILLLRTVYNIAQQTQS